jgi:hypothetical protein
MCSQISTPTLKTLRCHIPTPSTAAGREFLILSTTKSRRRKQVCS